MMDEQRRMRILVVEDNPDDRLLELREINALFPGSTVVEILDFAAFERALAFGAPDLVVTDLDLRWASGQEVLINVKAIYPKCPVVMFTGTGNETIAVELMKAGLDDYVVKSPRQLPRLRKSLKIAVELASSREALSKREMHLAQALAQQQTITRELHHRVKNNLQTITSLLHLHGRGTDGATRGHLDEIAGRMEALGAVQSRIYDTAQLDRVDFPAALNDIATSLVRVRGDSESTLVTRFECPLELDVSRAMPLSLLCYEFILNALKHAWPDGPGGALTVEVRKHFDQSAVRIADDGVGYAPGVVKNGLGSRLTRSLAKEAGVLFDVASAPNSGTCITIRIQE